MKALTITLAIFFHVVKFFVASHWHRDVEESDHFVQIELQFSQISGFHREFTVPIPAYYLFPHEKTDRVAYEIEFDRLQDLRMEREYYNMLSVLPPTEQIEVRISSGPADALGIYCYFKDRSNDRIDSIIKWERGLRRDPVINFPLGSTQVHCYAAFLPFASVSESKLLPN